MLVQVEVLLWVIEFTVVVVIVVVVVVVCKKVKNKTKKIYRKKYQESKSRVYVLNIKPEMGSKY